MTESDAHRRRPPHIRRAPARGPSAGLTTAALAATIVLAGALTAGCQQRRGDAGVAYTRGATNYATGTLNVTEPSLVHEPERSTEGLRVAGFDTDIDPGYWDERLASLPLVRTFELFEARHRDLEVMQAEAAPSALRAFRVWTRRRGLEAEFLDFWEDR